MDLAFLRLPDGRAWIGEGPFEETPATPEGPSFYINDFTLSQARPWKKPARLHAIRTVEELERFIPGAAAPRLVWRPPSTEFFEGVFRRIHREVRDGRLRKMVPVLTEKGRVERGDVSFLLRRVLQAPGEFWAYARIRGSAGFLGATPELLLTRKGARLETMALAGTARPSGAEDFPHDAKEIEEHELVANFLEETMRGLGRVRRDPREVSAAGELTHFRTRFSVELSKAWDDQELVRLLHPTPAVGCLPRDEGALRQLMACRHELGAGDYFGAPFGLETDEDFHCAVAIRGISWEGAEVSLPCGCGIVAGSSFDHEWRELRQKREAVANLLGI